MGTGGTILYLYGGCACFLAFVGLVAGALYFGGRRRRGRPRADGAGPGGDGDESASS